MASNKTYKKTNILNQKLKIDRNILLVELTVKSRFRDLYIKNIVSTPYKSGISVVNVDSRCSGLTGGLGVHSSNAFYSKECWRSKTVIASGIIHPVPPVDDPRPGNPRWSTSSGPKAG